ncbi:unnamed protein product, partial [Prorocentrum cordatum]
PSDGEAVACTTGRVGRPSGPRGPSVGAAPGAARAGRRGPAMWQRLWAGPAPCEDVPKASSLRPVKKLNSISKSEENRAASARVAELQAALAQERERVGQKDEELQAAGQLVAKLEQALELQQREQERIATLEEALAKRRGGEDVKVEKLLLAVAGEKQLAEERAEELGRARSQLAEARRLREEEQSKRQGEERWLAELDRQLGEAEARLADGERARAELQQGLLQEQQQLADVLQRREATVGELADLQRRRARDGGSPAAGYARDSTELQQQITEELLVRQQVQREMITNMQNLFAMQQQLAQERSLDAQGSALGWHSPAVPGHPRKALPWAASGSLSSGHPPRRGLAPQLWQGVPGGAASPGVAARDLGQAGAAERQLASGESPLRGHHQAHPAQYRLVSTVGGNVRYEQLQPGVRQVTRLASSDVQSRLDRGSTTFG